MRLPRGIVPVVQTPFTPEGGVDYESLERLVEDTIAAGAAGFLAPAVASEVSDLGEDERARIVECIARTAAGRAPLIAGASADRPDDCIRFARAGESMGAAACLVAAPGRLYGDGDAMVGFFERVARGVTMPLVIQDLDWSGPGLDLATARRLAGVLPSLVGLKIETVPAGPKYTQFRREFGPDFYIAGGWAAPQMIEALDRGVDALIPECSMVRVYSAVDRLYRSGDREAAVALFRELLPVLAFSNQEIRTCIAFFKRLLARKGIFATVRMRGEAFQWDEFNGRIADELIEVYLNLERRSAG